MGERVVITDGFDLYVKHGRGVYQRVNRRGRSLGGMCSHFQPRPRWRPAKVCCFDIRTDGLTCPRCGRYDIGYAETGERSFCANQLSPQQAKRLSDHPGDSSRVTPSLVQSTKLVEGVGPVPSDCE